MHKQVDKLIYNIRDIKEQIQHLILEQILQ